MEKYGLIREGKVIKTFEDKEVGFKVWTETEEREKYGFRELKFNELTEEGKLQSMEDKLNKLNLFLEGVKGSGRTYYSHTTIYSEELEWLIEHTKKNMKI